MSKHPTVKISHGQIADNEKQGFPAGTTVEMYFDCKIPGVNRTMRDCELIRTHDGNWLIQMTPAPRTNPVLTDDPTMVDAAIQSHIRLLRTLASRAEATVAA